MKLEGFPFQFTIWEEVEKKNYPGLTGEAIWQTQTFGKVRVRMVEYSKGYEADHWCEKGHILLCLEGELETTLQDGRVFKLSAGTSYQVSDGIDAHKSCSPLGAKLFIVD